MVRSKTVLRREPHLPDYTVFTLDNDKELWMQQPSLMTSVDGMDKYGVIHSGNGAYYIYKVGDEYVYKWHAGFSDEGWLVPYGDTSPDKNSVRYNLDECIRSIVG